MNIASKRATCRLGCVVGGSGASEGSEGSETVEPEDRAQRVYWLYGLLLFFCRNGTKTGTLKHGPPGGFGFAWGDVVEGG